MNRRLLILPVVGAAALAGSQLLGAESELPPEPVFPTVVNHTDQGWTEDDWSVNRFVDDPFDPAPEADPFEFEELTPGPELETGSSEEGAPPAPSTTIASATASTTTAPPPPTTPPPTTTARDLSQAPPLADDGTGVDLPEIDDLPDPVGAGGDR